MCLFGVTYDPSTTIVILSQATVGNGNHGCVSRKMKRSIKGKNRKKGKIKIIKHPILQIITHNAFLMESLYTNSPNNLFVSQFFGLLAMDTGTVLVQVFASSTGRISLKLGMIRSYHMIAKCC